MDGTLADQEVVLQLVGGCLVGGSDSGGVGLRWASLLEIASLEGNVFYFYQGGLPFEEDKFFPWVLWLRVEMPLKEREEEMVDKPVIIASIHPQDRWRTEVENVIFSNGKEQERRLFIRIDGSKWMIVD